AFLEPLVDDVGVDFLVRRQALELFGDVQELMQNELHIPNWRDVLTHIVLLTKVMMCVIIWWDCGNSRSGVRSRGARGRRRRGCAGSAHRGAPPAPGRTSRTPAARRRYRP